MGGGSLGGGVNVQVRLMHPRSSGRQDGGSTTVVPLDNVPAEVLAKVIEYCKYCVHTAPNVSLKQVDEWNEYFLNTAAPYHSDLLQLAIVSVFPRG